MTGYTKLFSSILASTVWNESKETKVLWITMLAMAGKHGEVQASIPGLAVQARLTVEETVESLQRLLAPDPYSRTKEFEGRRIEEIDGGWVLLNHAKYRRMMSQEERREYLRQKQAEHRARKKGASTPCQQSQQKSTMSTHAEAEAEAVDSSSSKKNAPKKKKVKKEPSERGLKFADWFRTTLPSGAIPDKSWRENWAVCFDEMIRLDKRTAEDIHKVCQWARSDDFWRPKFQSPLKLRLRNRDGILYFDVFTEQRKSRTNGYSKTNHGAPSSRNSGTANEDVHDEYRNVPRRPRAEASSADSGPLPGI